MKANTKRFHYGPYATRPHGQRRYWRNEHKRQRQARRGK